MFLGLRRSSRFSRPSDQVVSDNPILYHMMSLDPGSPKFRLLLAEFLQSGKELKNLGKAEDERVIKLADFLHGILEEQIPDELRNNLRHKVQRLCTQWRVLPTKLMIRDKVECSDEIEAQGGFSEVRKGAYRGAEVAVKSIAFNRHIKSERIMRVLCKEVIIWATLNHPNVVPFIGVTATPRFPSLITQWMAFGDIRSFSKRRPDIATKLLLDVAIGLEFIHKNGVVHGDLKGDNILVDSNCTARLADFGLASITVVGAKIPGFSFSQFRGEGTYAWMAPELLGTSAETVPKSKPADIYATGMVIYEVISHSVPYPSLRDPMVITKTLAGERPKRPATDITTDEIWNITVHCWDTNPVNRPSATGLRRYFEALMTGGPLPSLPSGNDPERLAPELFDNNFVSTPLPSPDPLSPPEATPLVRRPDPFDFATIPPLPPQYQLIPFPLNISKTEPFLIHDTIPFVFRDERGIPLADALEKRFNDLEGRDTPTDTPTANSNSFTLRLRFPGYEPQQFKIETRYALRQGRPLTKEGLAHRVAKQVQKFIEDPGRFNPECESRWEVGKGAMVLRNMLLVQVYRISRGSWQPELWLMNP